MYSSVRRSPFVAVPLLLALAGCKPTPTPTVHVDAGTQDATPPSSLWLQASEPGKPLQNVYLRSRPGEGDLSVEVGEKSVITLTALASDAESGIRRLEIDALVTKKRVSGNGWFTLLNHVSRGFGSMNLGVGWPIDAPTTAKITGVVDFGELSQGADWVVVDLAGVAFSGVSANDSNKAQTGTMVLYWKRPGTPPPQ